MSGSLHHIELWVDDVAAAQSSWGWLLSALGWTENQTWPDGASWRDGAMYLVVTRTPALSDDTHDRRRPGVNHLAFHAGASHDVDALLSAAEENGWSALYAERYPHAGGPDHYAAYLENAAGFKVELVGKSEA